MDLGSLPVEILSHIFKFLSLPDRKRVRLTCKLWNNACSRPTIVAREKFVFRHEYFEMMPLLCHYVFRCETLRPHFEFQGLNLQPLQPIWWKKCGERLTTLTLYNCHVNSKSLHNIILYCPNLRVLNIRSCVERTYSEDLLDNLIAQEIERENLVSLSLYAINVPNSWYRKLFLIYPNIRTLSQENIVARGMFPPKLENFTYWAQSNCLWMVPLCRNPRIKFKTLDVSLDLLIGCSKSLSVVTDFFSHQLDLEKIELAIFGDNRRTRELKALLFSLVKRLPKLKELAVRGIDVRMSSAEFSEFVLSISRLESFEFFGTLYTPGPVELLQLPTSMCHKMTKLQLPFYQDNLEANLAEQICLAILSQSYFLQYLSLGFVTEKILLRIFKINKELRALFLNFGSKVDNDTDGSKCLAARNENPTDLNIEYTIGQLRKLEHLEILGLKNADAFETLFSESELPRLKCFHFTARIEDKDPEERTSFAHRLLAIVSSGAPNLECLELRFGLSSSYHVTMSMSEVKKCCKELKNIRFFLTDAYLETRKPNGFVEEAKQLLFECPSLSYIRLGENMVIYDRFSTRELRVYPSFFVKVPCWKPNNFH